MKTETATPPSTQLVPAKVTHADGAAIIQVIERAALNPDVDIDKMERLLQMHERVLDRQALMAYSASMAAMQTELPSIVERGQGNNGGYATLEDIVDTVRPILQRHGFAVSFRIVTREHGIEVTGVLMHRKGHREETSMLLPADVSGNKNAVQAFGSSTSYGKRYVLCALLNITTRGQDDNGATAAPVRMVSTYQVETLERLLASCSPATVEWFRSNYEDASQVPLADFDRLRAALQKRAKRDPAKRDPVK